MIISPLEQFNILSVYDFSLVNLSSFEIFYAKFLLFSWYLICYLPSAFYFGVLNTFGDIPFFSGAITFVFSVYESLCSVISNAIYFLESQICKFLLQTNLILLFLVADSAYSLWHSSLVFLWHTLYTDLNLLYSADALILTKMSNLWFETSSFESDKSMTFLFENSNLALLGTHSVFSLASISLIFSESLFWFWTQLYSNSIEQLLDLNSKQFAFLIFSLNTSTIWLGLGFLFITFLLTTVTSKTHLLEKNTWQSLLEALYSVILGVVSENAGAKGIKHFPLIFTTFMLILVCNLLGMIPYSFTVTSHLIVTFSIALAIFIGINILGILLHGKHFLSLFFPPGAPLALAPLLVMIELVSYVFRVLSLSIRLFANLMSGHTLLKILSSFGWLAVSFWGLFLIPIGVIFLITGLELAIACLQAYIFSVLLCIYINDAFNLH